MSNEPQIRKCIQIDESVDHALKALSYVLDKSEREIVIEAVKDYYLSTHEEYADQLDALWATDAEKVEMEVTQ